jgi:hypothetical protein
LNVPLVSFVAMRILQKPECSTHLSVITIQLYNLYLTNKDFFGKFPLIVNSVCIKFIALSLKKNKLI